MRILVGGPTRETESSLFHTHVEGLEAQAFPGVELVFQHDICTDPGGPRWTGDKIHRVAALRQGFLDYANSQFDALFMVDSDLILGPGVLRRMLEAPAPAVYGVFWTRADWGGSMAEWPQVWNVNPYGWTQDCADQLREPGVNEVEVLGGGACTLIRGAGFESRYAPLLKSLVPLPGMWGGEDRSYCLGLEARGIKQLAVTGLQIHHCYTLQDQTRPALKRIKEAVGL